MAGFALFMTFVSWGFILLIVAIILSIVLFRSAKRGCPQPTTSCRLYRVASVAAPFAALLWLAFAIILHVKISNTLAHQSVGFSPDPYVTLPNGFKLGSLNTYDGYIVAPGYRTDVPVTGPGYVRSIIDVVWQGDTFRGHLFDFNSSTEKSFIFNTANLHIQLAPNGPQTWDAANDRAQMGPESYWILYKHYRHRWPTYAFLAILIMGELLIGWSVFRLQRRAIDETAQI